MSTTQEWTVEELVAELKRRERRGRSADGLGPPAEGRDRSPRPRGPGTWTKSRPPSLRAWRRISSVSSTEWTTARISFR